MIERLWNDGRAVLRARWYFRKASRLGEGVRLWGHPVVDNRGKMMIGNRVRLVSTVVRSEFATGSNGTLEIGERTFINYGCSFGATELIRIGAHCTIGTHVIMMDSDFHHVDPDRRNEQPPPHPIILEPNVWLGARVIVLQGVTIGEGSVVGAGSVVTRNIPARSLAAGVPAKVIRAL